MAGPLHHPPPLPFPFPPPQNYRPTDEGPQEYQSIPLDKIEDFGVHCKRYYSLSISYFKSSLDSRLLDLLWNKYWVNTLSSSPLLMVRSIASGSLAVLGAGMCHKSRSDTTCMAPPPPVSTLPAPVMAPPPPCLQNAEYTSQQIGDLAQKLDKVSPMMAAVSLSRGERGGGGLSGRDSNPS